MSEALANKAGFLNEEADQYCGFRIGKDIYGILVTEVQEVIKPQRVTKVPLSNECIEGLINLRGQIVTQINLRKLLGIELGPGMNSESYMNVVVRNNGNLTAFMVDEICDVIEVTDNTFEAPPNTLNENLKKYVNGVYALKDQTLISLNLNKIINYLD